MARKQLQNMQLPESGYNPIVFQGYTTEGPEYDTNILANSIGRLDTAIEKTNEQTGAIKESLAKVKAQLNPALHPWFDEYSDKTIIKPMSDMIEAGNYGDAINFGNNQGRGFLDDKNISNALLLTDAYNRADEQAKKIIGTGEGYEWWKKRNTFDVNKLIDENGNIVNAGYFNDIKAPYERLNLPNIIGAAIKSVAPKKYDGKQGGVRKQGERLDKKPIVENAYGIISSTPDGIAALEQEYDIYVYGLEELDNQIRAIQSSADFDENNKNYKDLLNKKVLRQQLLEHNGQKIDISNEEGRKLFLERIIDNNPLIKNATYNYNSTFADDNNTSNTGGSYTGTGGLQYSYNGSYYPQVIANGANIRVTSDFSPVVNDTGVLFGQDGWNSTKNTNDVKVPYLLKR